MVTPALLVQVMNLDGDLQAVEESALGKAGQMWTRTAVCYSYHGVFASKTHLQAHLTLPVPWRVCE